MPANITVKFARLGQPAVEVLMERGSTLADALDAAGIDVNSDVRAAAGGGVVDLDTKITRNAAYIVALGTKVENGL